MFVKIFIETSFGLALFINALLFVPQAMRLFKMKNSQGVSLITFAGFNLIQMLCVLHGYLHKDYIFMIGSILSFLSCGCVTLLIIFYKICPTKNNIL